jgi:homocysteine S-methyltransferase
MPGEARPSGFYPSATNFLFVPKMPEPTHTSSNQLLSTKHRALHRDRLPQLGDQLFISDGGLETSLIFQEKLHLPLLAAYPLVCVKSGREKLLEYYRRYADLARRYRTGLILETPTWRANPDWIRKLAGLRGQLEEVNRKSVWLMEQIRREYSDLEHATVISGCIGPRGDGYVPSSRMTAREAEGYHSHQIAVIADTAADLVSAFTLNYVEEAIGIASAARKHEIPVAISFTVETDGKLPAGQTLKESIQSVDAATDATPAYYMINCSHPSHFIETLISDEPWVKRIRAIRANASRCSHAELDAATELDQGDPIELAQRYSELREVLPHLTVIGGCCGTDHRHVAAICDAVHLPVRPGRAPNSFRKQAAIVQ